MAYEPENCPHGTDRKQFNCVNCQAEEAKANAPATLDQARAKAVAIVEATVPPRRWQHFVLLIRDDGSEVAMAYHPDLDTKDLEDALAQIAGHLRAQGDTDAERPTDDD